MRGFLYVGAGILEKRSVKALDAPACSPYTRAVEIAERDELIPEKLPRALLDWLLARGEVGTVGHDSHLSNLVG